MILRIKGLLRRSASKKIPPPAQELPNVLSSSSGVRLDLDTHIATLNNVPLQLRPKEFELLSHFIRHAGLALSRDQILEKVWGYEYIGDSRTVDVHVRWLREKIEHDPSKPETIITIRGTGYRFIK